MLKHEFFRKWRFGFLLFAILLTVVIEPILFGPRAASWIFDIAYSVILVSAVYAISSRRRGGLFVIALGVFALSATWVYHIVPESFLKEALILHHVLGVGFLLIMVLATLKGLFMAEEINVDVLLGTVAGYLMLGIAWALIHSLADLASSETAFDFGSNLGEFVENRNSRFSVFVYYSFVTLTTLGYGDVVPVSQAARTLSWLEAAVGQFYIATLVAGVVGVFASAQVRGHRQVQQLRVTKRDRKKRRP